MHRVSFRLVCSALAVACYAAPAWAQYNDPFTQTSVNSSVQMLPATHTSTGSSYVVTSHAGSCDECCDTCDDACCDTCEDVCSDTCDTCCDVCDDACCEPKSCKTYFAGFEATFLDPHFEDGNVPGTGLIGAIGAALGNPGGLGAVAFPSDDFDFQFAPRFYAGMMDETGFGARAAYWWFDSESDSASISSSFDLAGGMLNVTDTVQGELELHVLDLEAFQAVTMNRWTANLGAGIRIAKVRVASDMLLDGNAVGGGFDGATGSLLIATEQDFTGFGPTISGELRREVGNGLSVFAKGRYALIFGKNDASASATIAATDFLPFLDGTLAIENNDIEDFLSVYEIQLGTAYEYQSGANRFFVTAAWEAQLWAGAGGYQDLLGDLSQFNAILPPGGPLATPEGDIGFSGFTVGVGMAR